MGNKFIKDYFKEYKKLLKLDDKLLLDLNKIKKLFESTKTKNKVMIFGNGASASIASHIAVDLTKNAKVTATAYNDSALLTCFSNDFGYTDWVSKAIEFYGKPNDVAVFISSSGMSSNIIRGANEAFKRNINIVTLTGINYNNSLQKNKGIHLFVKSSAYNLIESIHQFYLSCVVDMLIGKMEYKV